MKKVRYKIALLVGGSVLMTLMLILLLFNLLMRRQIDRNARESVGAAVQPASIDQQLLYIPSVIELPNGLQDISGSRFSSEAEKAIAEACRKDPPKGAEKLTIGGHTYYVCTDTLLANAFEVVYDGENTVITETNIAESSAVCDELPDGTKLPNGEISVIGYVDVTGELKMIRNMNIFFLAAAAVICAVGSVEGYLIGRRLEQNQLSQKRFFENTSHELKTPLTAIRGYAEGIGTGVITDYKKTGLVIASQTEKMSRLVEDILMISKLESGAMTLEKEPLRLGEFIENCLMPLEGAVMSRGLEVTLELAEGTVSADPDRLDMAVSNLLTNAVKYARSRLEIRFDGRTVTIANDSAQLTDEEVGHIFERFYTGKNGSTGIGLALAKDIIELHGWGISARSSGDGIEFVITVK